MPGDVLVVVDMQVGLLDGAAKHDLPGVMRRINALAAMVRLDPRRDDGRADGRKLIALGTPHALLDRAHLPPPKRSRFGFAQAGPARS